MSPFQGQRRNCHVIWLKTAQRLFLILNTLGCRQLPCSGDLCSHNRLLRRQHCSSLCLQSEGHEHVANMSSVLGNYFVGFSSRAWPPNICPPHFASKVSYSASPHANTDCQRTREQRQSSLGAETSASGCRDERRWDGVQLCLLLRALPVVRTGFTEVGFLLIINRPIKKHKAGFPMRGIQPCAMLRYQPICWR